MPGTGKNRKQVTQPISLLSPGQVVIDQVEPQIEGGRFPIKRLLGEEVRVSANVYADGHDLVCAALLYRQANEDLWTEVPMSLCGGDNWTGKFEVTQIGNYSYTLLAWIDRFGSWRRDLAKKVDAGQDVSVDLLVGVELAEQAANRASGKARKQLEDWTNIVRSLREIDRRAALGLALDESSAQLIKLFPNRSHATTYEKELSVVVDRERAQFGSWYEMFPRSTSSQPGRHGTFKDCESRLPYVAGMGFDVLYFPPIHPIGTAFRKGKNNNPKCEPGDPGSPWAIGAKGGGHKAIHTDLGTPEDFNRLVRKAREYGMEIALDIAYQCSPDHPYVQEHPQWFRRRPDGTVQYAENPPKKYQDIYPLEFENESWRELWEELKSVVTFWADHGVRIFRVDNPHTKPFAFWEWLIREVKVKYPDVIFLAEAFTRPIVMYRLAKLGFTQSYTYFTWRNGKQELIDYFTELTQTSVREFFRPNLWPNTPDILHATLQNGGRPAFISRCILAATLGASYGIYGPAFELCENKPFAPGSEEYFNSEKYEIKTWDIDRSDSLKDLISKVNRIRRENTALQSNGSLRFHNIDNDRLIAYSKRSRDGSNTILVVVNLDPAHTQAAMLDLPPADMNLDPGQPFQVHDLLTDARYRWQGSRNYVELNPRVLPAHIFVIRRRVRIENGFEYFE